MHFSRYPGDGAVDFGSGAQHRGWGRGRQVPAEPGGDPADTRRFPRGILRCSWSLCSPPECPLHLWRQPRGAGPGSQGVVPHPKKPQLHCAVQVHQHRLCPLAKGQERSDAYLRFQPLVTLKVPQPGCTHAPPVPPPCPLPRPRGAVPSIPGLRASPPSRPLHLRVAEPPPPLPAAGNSSQPSPPPPGAASGQAGTSGDVCTRSGCGGDGNFISFYWFSLHLELK